ncbi:MAG: hypothetical protein N2747_02770 [Chitinophagaceae bacterium]|nr:hypothetical protein [Chitinophagaceae bacterium]
MDRKQFAGLTRNEWAYLFAILTGLVIGIAVRRVKIGIFLALIFCALIGLSSFFRFFRK